jgi:hypothetical protein
VAAAARAPLSKRKELKSAATDGLLPKHKKDTSYQWPLFGKTDF